MNIQQIVKDAIAESLCQEPEFFNGKENENIKNFGTDSLDLLHIAFLIESKLNIKFDDDTTEDLSTINHIVKYIEKKIQ